MRARTLRAHIKRNDPTLWAEIQHAGLRRAAFLGWPLPRAAGLTLTGSRSTPIGGGPMLCTASCQTCGAFRNETEVWQGVPDKYLQFSGPDKAGVLWARPRTGDPAGLAVQLQLALASWGASRLPMPGTYEDRVRGRLLTYAAAERGDIEGMKAAYVQHGIDSPDEYEGVLRLAGTRGDVACVQVLLGLVGDEVATHAYIECEYFPPATLSPGTRVVGIATYVRAGIPIPLHLRAAVAYVFVESLIDREKQNKLRAMKSLQTRLASIPVFQC